MPDRLSENTYVGKKKEEASHMLYLHDDANVMHISTETFRKRKQPG